MLLELLKLLLLMSSRTKHCQRRMESCGVVRVCVLSSLTGCLLFANIVLVLNSQCIGRTDAEIFERLELLLMREVPEHGQQDRPGYVPRQMIGLKGFTQATRTTLVQEMAEYRRLAQLQAPILAQTRPKDQPEALWKWWWLLQEHIPAWFNLANEAVLHQPSSAAVERFFSITKGSTSSQQSTENDNTTETRCMCRYNK